MPKIMIFCCALNGKHSALHTNSIIHLSKHFSYPNTSWSQHVRISDFLYCTLSLLHTGMHISIVDGGVFNEGKQVYRHESVNTVHMEDFEG